MEAFIGLTKSSNDKILALIQVCRELGLHSIEEASQVLTATEQRLLSMWSSAQTEANLWAQHPSTL